MNVQERARVATAVLAALTLACSPVGTATAADNAAHAQVANGPMAMGQGEESYRANHTTIPAGLMGAHMVPAGRFMLSYSGMSMHMEDNYIGSSKISPQSIVTTIPNVMGHMGGMGMGPPPATLRVVPIHMDMRMHMLGGMYGISDTINLMVMGTYLTKEMEMLTFAGASGTAIRGTSSSTTEGLGDTSVTALVQLYRDGTHRLHANVGVSLPTGSITERVRMLAPNGSQMEMRASYGMQLGTGTYDALPGLTYTGRSGPMSWGLAYRGRISLEGGNDSGWRSGDLHEATGWLGYELTPALTATGRVAGSTQASIEGNDALIRGPMQAANPSFYGGEKVELFGGLEVRGKPLGLGHTRLAIEAGAPVCQNLNGPPTR